MCGFELLLLVVVACDLWRTLVLAVEGVVAVAFVVDDM